jgi:hypothetical protein
MSVDGVFAEHNRKDAGGGSILCAFLRAGASCLRQTITLDLGTGSENFRNVRKIVYAGRYGLIRFRIIGVMVDRVKLPVPPTSQSSSTARRCIHRVCSASRRIPSPLAGVHPPDPWGSQIH